MYVPVGSYHVFGSGSARVCLKVDGLRCHGEDLRQKSLDNGFVGDVLVSTSRMVETPRLQTGKAPPCGRGRPCILMT